MTMLAPLLSTAPANPPGRISQLLPTVKCSNCNQPVPLSELGDHICVPPPAVPTLPKPSVSPAAAASLLPPRLQGRLGSPSPTSPRPTSNNARPGSSPPRAPEPPQQRLGPPRINTGSPASSTYQQRSSPLARNEPDRSDTSSPAGRSRFVPASPSNNPTPPLHIRPPPPGDIRARTMSNAGSISSSPSSPRTARPSFSSGRGPEPPNNMGRPPPPREMNPPPNTRSPPPREMNPSPNPRGPPPNVRVPLPPLQMPYVPVEERDIDTKIGGEAGMAGVGRRGFAAAARAAMFVSPTERERPGGPQPNPSHRENAPRYLNTDIPTRSNGTPPLSAGSGYSSHSPGVSPYPQSPVAAPPQHPPSPDRHGSKAPPSQPQPIRDMPPLAEAPKANLPTSPISVRMPFFEKFRNQLPGVSVPESGAPVPVNNTNVDTPSTAVQQVPQQHNRSQSQASSASSYSILPSRSGSMSTTASRRLPEKPTRPLSPTSESDSEYGGLAYADSTDYEEEDDTKDAKSTKGKANPPPPLPLTSSILRSTSTASTNHVRFPSASDRSSERSGIRIPPSRNGGHKRDASLSSVSSVSSVGESRKSNSAVIAHALGLSQTPPSEYGRLGGPGIGVGRKSTSGSSSSGSRSTHSRGVGAVTAGLGVMEREVKTLLEDVNANVSMDEQRRAGLSKSKSTGKQRSFGDNPSGSNGAVKIAQRSNTVQGIVPAPEQKSPKLPARARTSTDRERGMDANREKKERVRKARVCLKCSHKIEDGRWVQMDNGGVLCEKCWKNMYLPKCRRCNLPIEKQAVSSADGQLKGKYHRECFNCHTCHKPFPDKSFYVFDGKPLCAYHYHEENDSLCAAALCGQPIEGPCAVSHTGDRYHPEHMTCEYPGNLPCKERLEEYWEVDGRMLCERHAHASKVGSDDEGEGEEEWVQSSRALKRVTRFIDLGGSDLR
ncbi:hypothetical protein Hypma_011867 [Hypsizygus marmoreus]|uniref:LIM zinc-binding domain-containing protein n=1 Tax=Hypsizygus marmoreus TaxID=39966 RepID=A0A369JQN3_HYPMA|nr:hypothetical protein Hypma_011867 [Hypsizygus marmoreus]